MKKVERGGTEITAGYTAVGVLASENNAVVYLYREGKGATPFQFQKFNNISGTLTQVPSFFHSVIRGASGQRSGGAP